MQPTLPNMPPAATMPGPEDFARLTVIGSLNRKPELRRTPEGVAVTTISVCANLDGEPYYWDFSLFGSQAETAVETLSIGSRVYVEGPPKKNRWFGKSGEPLARLTWNAKTFVPLFTVKQ